VTYVAAVTCRVVDRMADVPREAWDALSAGDDRVTPFTSWTFLDALEQTGCAVPARGWKARHVTIWRGPELVAAMPAYAKSDHQGDFARDWVWAEPLERAGVSYYPRLQITVPITPVTGRRLLIAPGEDRPEMIRALMQGARDVAKQERMSSVHVLFALPEEITELETVGFARRMDFQAHWFNDGFQDPQDWLTRALNAKSRHMMKRERSFPAEQGITIRTVRGDEVASSREEWGREAWGFYHATTSRMMWSRPWLTEGFFRRIFERMPGPLELVVAERAGARIAGAFNVQSGDRLFGRYWGAHEDHNALHFNVCFHHSIDDCIARNLRVFEGGAGGEHKLHKGFDVAATHSAHAFLQPQIDTQIRRFLAMETAAREGVAHR
jgi:uncharacterized protein